MTRLHLVIRTAVYHRRMHVAVALGAALATAVIVGALGAGDSVRYSLRRTAEARVGKVACALVAADRFFRADLAQRIGTNTAALLLVGGMAIADGGAVRVNDAQVLGVDARFWTMSEAGACPVAALGADDAVVSARLAQRLGLRMGSMLLVRVAAPSALPHDLAFADANAAQVALRVRVAAVADAQHFGLFGLKASQVPPCTVFLSRDWLGSKLGLASRANAVIAGAGWTTGSLATAAASAWRLEDAGLKIEKCVGEAEETHPSSGNVRQLSVRQYAGEEEETHPSVPSREGKEATSPSPPLPRENGEEEMVCELFSDRVFLDAAATNAALSAGFDARGVFVYFVNELRVGSNAAPYSFVASDLSDLSDMSDRSDLSDNAVVVSPWLAADLAAKPGDFLALSFFVLGPLRTLVETSVTLRVQGTQQPSGVSTPDFPGLSGADNCRDWKPGIPIDLSRIRPKDEAYWREHRALSKAAISLATAQRLWGNQYGALTSVRYATDDTASLASAIMARLPPAACGVQVLPLRDTALKASAESVDFGQLFAGLSMFLIAASVLLTVLLFAFAIDQRARQTGTLLALGFTPQAIRAMYCAEGGVVAIIGGLAGAIAGIGYTALVIAGLRTVWHGAVGAAELAPYVTAQSLVIGFCASVIASVAGMWLALRRHSRQPVRVLLTGGIASEAPGTRILSRIIPIVVLLCTLAGAGLVTFALITGGVANVGVFFAAGFLLLVAGICTAHIIVRQPARQRVETASTFFRLAVRLCARRSGRSTATIALVACGVFMVIAVAANRQGMLADPWRRSAGTGGFALYGESAVPIARDLNTHAVRASLGLDSNLLADVSFVQMRVRSGDDASCLNLNRAQQPRMIGVPPQAFARRGSFSVVQQAEGIDPRNPWPALDNFGTETVPAFVDASVLQWGLGKRVGDRLDFLDDSGHPGHIVIVGALADSVFQGSLVISERVMRERFPDSSQPRALLVDTPREQAAAVARALSWPLQDYGLELMPATERLAAFTAVQNTYLSIFLALGGLGLVLGTAGLGIVLLRNMIERRRELAIMLALGFTRMTAARMVFIEHMWLLVLGLCVGVGAAAVAVAPCAMAPGADVPFAMLALLVAGIFANGCLWTWVASRWAMRGELIDALRE